MSLRTLAEVGPVGLWIAGKLRVREVMKVNRKRETDQVRLLQCCHEQHL